MEGGGGGKVNVSMFVCKLKEVNMRLRQNRPDLTCKRGRRNYKIRWFFFFLKDNHQHDNWIYLVQWWYSTVFSSVPSLRWLYILSIPMHAQSIQLCICLLGFHPLPEYLKNTFSFSLPLAHAHWKFEIYVGMDVEKVCCLIIDFVRWSIRLRGWKSFGIQIFFLTKIFISWSYKETKYKKT